MQTNYLNYYDLLFRYGLIQKIKRALLILLKSTAINHSNKLEV